MFERQVDYSVCAMGHRIFGVKGTTEALKHYGKELADNLEDFICAVGLGVCYIHSTKTSLGTGNFHADQVSKTKYQFQVSSDIQNVNIPWELDQQGVSMHKNFFHGRLCF